MRKKANPVRNKNSNRINVFNSIRIGSNKKRSNRKKSNSKSGVSSIVVNVPQSIPQPFYIPTPMNAPFHMQPPVQIANPTRIMKDEMDREIISANSEYIKSKPTFVEPIKNELQSDSSTTSTKYFSTASMKSQPPPPQRMFFTDEVDSDSEVQPIPLKSPQSKTSLNKMKQSELHNLAQQMGISIFDPSTQRRRTMVELRKLIATQKII